jgi:hypothetical protein
MTNMSKKIVENESFALRHGEQYKIIDIKPIKGRWIAIMAQSVQFPFGPYAKARQSDGAPVEQAAILACQMVDGLWQWLQLSPPTKENIGDLLFDSGADKDAWYYLEISETISDDGK